MIRPRLHPRELELPACEFGTTAQLMAAAGRGDEPTVVMLTCWELGGAPQELSFAPPERIMVAQNPGGLVPAADAHLASSSLDTIRYALTRPTVRHLIVCGHTQCKTLGLLLQQDALAASPLRNLFPSINDRRQATPADRSSSERQELLVQASVLQQLANLRTHADIRRRLEAGRLLLHGWVRNDRTATIKPYDPAAGRFAA